jgi:uncharacterized membrane protein
MTAVERLPARVLLWGALLGVALMTLGTAVYALGGGVGPGVAVSTGAGASSRSTMVLHSVDDTWRALRRRPVDPVAVATAGTLLLLATPILAVAAACVMFARAGDGRYVAVAAIVLAALLIGLMLGTG